MLQLALLTRKDRYNCGQLLELLHGAITLIGD